MIDQGGTAVSVERLTSLIASGHLPPRAGKHCEQLLDRLSRPVSIGLFGAEDTKIMLRDAVDGHLPPHSLIAVPPSLAEIDIPIWCSAVSPDEDLAWQAWDESAKDRGLFVTVSIHSSPLSSAATASTMSLWLTPDDPSSSKTVCDHLSARLTAGRNADLDSAEMLIQRYSNADPAPSPAPAKLSQPMETSPLQAASDYVHGIASELADLPLDGDAPDVAPVLVLCREAAASVVTMLEPCDDPALCDAAVAAEDQIQLMELEGDISSARDSVTCILQLQRDLGVRLAS